MRVVVVVCVRNEEKVISKMLRSLVNQTVVPEKIVIVNDGSIDNTAEELVVWAYLYPSLVIVINREDRVGGENLAGTPELAKAFNIAFAYVEEQEFEYDYLMVCGADDEYPEDYIEELIGRMMQDELVVVASGRESGKKTFSKTSSRGAGRLITKKWWEEYGQRYAYPSYYWETKCIMIARMRGYKTAAYYDIVFHTRKQCSVYGHHRYGVMHRSINYRKFSVLVYFGRLIVQFEWRSAFNYLIGYVKKPKRIIQKDRQLSEDWKKWLKKKK